MTPMEAERWARRRAIGPVRFVCYFGVLAWGLPSGVLFIAGMLWFVVLPQVNWSTFVWSDPINLLIAVPVIGGLLIWMLMGVPFGILFWSINEARFRLAGKVSCSRCGYDLAGLSTTRCPECGENLPSTCDLNTSREDAS